MNDLNILFHQGTWTVDSREVADLVDKRHADLLETINGYTEVLTNGKFRSLDFFIPDCYQDAKNETRPCFKITRKGCDMIAHKMTSKKGILFSAAYINKFDQMEREQQNKLNAALHKEIVEVAKKKRLEFTDVLQAHGCTAKYHYINITKGMKQKLNIDPKKKKADCGTLEVMAIACSENLATLGIMMSGSEGYYECRDVSCDAAGKVREIAASGQLKLELKAGV